MENLTNYYNDLVPPSNPRYPWCHPAWQLLCYYCTEPITETLPEAGARQRTVYMRGRWLHKDTEQPACDPAKLRPNTEIDDPRCGCCQTQSTQHKSHCSVGGKPPYSATPISDKEDELIRAFGWHPNVQATNHQP